MICHTPFRGTFTYFANETSELQSVHRKWEKLTSHIINYVSYFLVFCRKKLNLPQIGKNIHMT